MNENSSDLKKGWAIILGASSGFGAAIARELSNQGYSIFGVHLDRRSTMPNVETIVRDIQSNGQEAVFFNSNAADAKERSRVLGEIKARFDADGTPRALKVLVHSLAFGTLRPFLLGGPDEALSQSQMEMTIDVMASSLVYWTQGIIWGDLMGEGGRIFAMTSAGSTHVITNYGAVSAAKAALESNIRQIAAELAPRGITANSIRAGVTQTPALRKIPGFEKIVERGAAKNPSGRITTPQDVARAVSLFCDERSSWITGNVIGVDGGEEIVS